MEKLTRYQGVVLRLAKLSQAITPRYVHLNLLIIFIRPDRGPAASDQASILDTTIGSIRLSPTV